MGLMGLHWLPVAARIQFKTLVLAYRAANGTAPSYLQDMVKPYTPARPLRSAASMRLVAPSLKGPSLLGPGSSRFWPHSGGMNSLLISGQQSHCPSFAAG